MHKPVGPRLAEPLVAETEDRWAEAELYRVRGELLRAGHDSAGGG